MSGFFSKDVILEIMLINNYNLWVLMLAYTATLFTVGYSARIAIKLFHGARRREPFSLESDRVGPLRLGFKILVFPSIIGGLFLTGFLPFRDAVLLPF